MLNKIFKCKWAILISTIIGLFVGSTITYGYLTLLDVARALADPPFVDNKWIKDRLEIDSTKSFPIPESFLHRHDIQGVAECALDGLIIDSAYSKEPTMLTNRIEYFRYSYSSGFSGIAKVEYDSIERMNSISFYNSYDGTIFKNFSPSFHIRYGYTGNNDNDMIVYSSLYDEIFQVDQFQKCSCISERMQAIEADTTQMLEDIFGGTNQTR